MNEWIILGGILLFIIFSVLITAYVCFVRIFYANRRKSQKEKTKITAPVVDGFAPFRPQIGMWMREVEAMDGRELEIISHDGLKLCGSFYEYEKGAPIEIMFHGYRGNGKRDLSGGVVRAFKQGRSALIVDHRASGRSEGSVVTFGINESRDCILWAELVAKKIAPDSKIILTGISMGAATVMIAAGRDDLPENVAAVIADCGYTSAKDIIKNTMRDMRLPADLLYPFARLGGKIFGGFDIDETSPVESMGKCKVPIIFLHGDADLFVPFDMSRRNFEACAAERKRLVSIKGAGHGVAYPTDPDKYLSELADFFEGIL
jgi:fermentation-respiration switch protein FrsA (DUF1100 family)